MNPGTLLKRRYTLAACIGQGTTGEVYRALDAQTGQAVAIKVIARDLALDSEMLKRFKREAEALCQLKHPNIVGFVDAFQHEGQSVIVSEFVSGGSLRDMLKTGPFAVDRARQIALDLCDALTHAHRLGFMHGDLKPENILFDSDGMPRLSDFGLAQLVRESARATGTQASIAAPHYLSPEAWQGLPLDAQADLWSLGTVLYEMLSGALPFPGDTAAQVMRQALSAQPPDLRTAMPGLPPGMADIVARMLARDKAKRYQTARQVAVDLEAGTAEPRAKEKGGREKGEERRGRGYTAQVVASVTVLVMVLAIALNLLLAQRTQAFAGQINATQTALALRPAVNTTTAIPPTASPTESVPTLTPVPTSTLTRASTLTEALPTVTLSSSPIQPPPTPTAPQPPLAAQKGLTWTSPIDGMTLVSVPAGEFLMGSTSKGKGTAPESPQHLVYLDAFWIDRTEVSNAQFARFVAATGYQTDAEKEGTSFILALHGGQTELTIGANWQHPRGPETDLTGQDNYAVVQISWNDATAYCAWAGRHLPTEAQWEKAARGTDGRMYPWGDDTTPRGNVANFADKNMSGGNGNQNIDDGYSFLAPVTAYPAGASLYGALNLAGNAREWVADFYSWDYYTGSPLRNPAGPAQSARCQVNHFQRGGDWTTEWYIHNQISINGGLNVSVRDAGGRWDDLSGSSYARDDGSGFRCAVGTAP